MPITVRNKSINTYYNYLVHCINSSYRLFNVFQQRFWKVLKHWLLVLIVAMHKTKLQSELSMNFINRRKDYMKDEQKIRNHLWKNKHNNGLQLLLGTELCSAANEKHIRHLVKYQNNVWSATHSSTIRVRYTISIRN